MPVSNKKLLSIISTANSRTEILVEDTGSDQHLYIPILAVSLHVKDNVIKIHLTRKDFPNG